MFYSEEEEEAREGGEGDLFDKIYLADEFSGIKKRKRNLTQEIPAGTAVSTTAN